MSSLDASSDTKSIDTCAAWLGVQPATLSSDGEPASKRLFQLGALHDIEFVAKDGRRVGTSRLILYRTGSRFLKITLEADPMPREIELPDMDGEAVELFAVAILHSTTTGWASLPTAMVAAPVAMVHAIQVLRQANSWELSKVEASFGEMLVTRSARVDYPLLTALRQAKNTAVYQRALKRFVDQPWCPMECVIGWEAHEVMRDVLALMQKRVSDVALDVAKRARAAAAQVITDTRITYNNYATMGGDAGTIMVDMRSALTDANLHTVVAGVIEKAKK